MYDSTLLALRGSGRVSNFPEKNVTKMYNFQEKMHYVRLEWPLRIDLDLWFVADVSHRVEDGASDIVDVLRRDRTHVDAPRLEKVDVILLDEVRHLASWKDTEK